MTDFIEVLGNFFSRVSDVLYFASTEVIDYQWRSFDATGMDNFKFPGLLAVSHQILWRFVKMKNHEAISLLKINQEV